MRPMRHCWICYGDEGDDWLSPCKCSGSLKYVHTQCLQAYVATGSESCPQCLYRYRFKESQRIYFVRFASGVRSLWNITILTLSATGVLLGVSVLGSVYSFASLAACVGVDETMALFEDTRVVYSLPLLLLSVENGLLLLPFVYYVDTWYSLLLVSFSPFISYSYGYAKRMLTKYLIETESEESQDQVDDNRTVIDLNSISRRLTLPFIAAFIGRVFFARFKARLFVKSAFGGVLFVLLRDGLDLVYKYQRRIFNFERKPLNLF